MTITAYYKAPVCLVNDGGIASNVAAAIARDLPRVCSKPPKPGRLAIVASGPSAADHLDELLTWNGEIWAINGAFCWLIGEGIVPHGFVALDPGEGLEHLLTVVPERSTYYLSAICDRGLFDHLKNRAVKLWFSAHEGIDYPPGFPVIKGGTTCLTRAPFLAYEMGWRDITIFGGDSSYRGDEFYCYDPQKYECSVPPYAKNVCVGDELFVTCYQMMCQVSFLVALTETPRFAPILKYRADGLLKALLDAPIQELDMAVEVV